jgi:hypothetical protein
VADIYKLGRFEAGQWIEHSHPAVYRVPGSSDELQHIVVSVPNDDANTFLRLASILEEPYLLLYVLHTPRGEGDPGRYQSPSMSLRELQSFIVQFSSLLTQDARFDLWVHSPSEKATIVWDRHSQIFTYGPLDRFEAELRQIGFAVGAPEVPTPHEHNYWTELDSEAREILSVVQWAFSPLKAEDIQ